MSYRPYADPQGSYADYATPDRPVPGYTLPTGTATAFYEVTHVYFRKDQNSPEIELLIPFQFGYRPLDQYSEAYCARYKSVVESGIDKFMLDSSTRLLKSQVKSLARSAIEFGESLLPSPAFSHGSREQILRTIVGLLLGKSEYSPFKANPFPLPSDVMLTLRKSINSDSEGPAASVTARMAAFFYLMDLKLYEWKIELDVENISYISALPTSVTDGSRLFDTLLQSCRQMTVAFGSRADPGYVGLRVTSLTKRRDVEQLRKSYPQVMTVYSY